MCILPQAGQDKIQQYEKTFICGNFLDADDNLWFE